jgi:hypothetical protein
MIKAAFGCQGLQKPGREGGGEGKGGLEGDLGGDLGGLRH